jgi:DNA relaxase NicK
MIGMLFGEERLLVIKVEFGVHLNSVLFNIDGCKVNSTVLPSRICSN